MSQINYYTEEGLKKLKDELHHMKTVQRPSISDQIAEARDKGDLSENAEYDAAKEAQGLLEMKISKMEGILANARLIDDSNIDTSKVFILSKVKIKNVTNGMEMEYMLVKPDGMVVMRGLIMKAFKEEELVKCDEGAIGVSINALNKNWMKLALFGSPPHNI